MAAAVGMENEAPPGVLIPSIEIQLSPEIKIQLDQFNEVPPKWDHPLLLFLRGSEQEQLEAFSPEGIDIAEYIEHVRQTLFTPSDIPLEQKFKTLRVELGLPEPIPDECVYKQMFITLQKINTRILKYVRDIATKKPYLYFTDSYQKTYIHHGMTEKVDFSNDEIRSAAENFCFVYPREEKTHVIDNNDIIFDLYMFHRLLAVCFLIGNGNLYDYPNKKEGGKIYERTPFFRQSEVLGQRFMREIYPVKTLGITTPNDVLYSEYIPKFRGIIQGNPLMYPDRTFKIHTLKLTKSSIGQQEDLNKIRILHTEGEGTCAIHSVFLSLSPMIQSLSSQEKRYLGNVFRFSYLYYMYLAKKRKEYPAPESIPVTNTISLNSKVTAIISAHLKEFENFVEFKKATLFDTPDFFDTEFFEIMTERLDIQILTFTVTERVNLGGNSINPPLRRILVDETKQIKGPPRAFILAFNKPDLHWAAGGILSDESDPLSVDAVSPSIKEKVHVRTYMPYEEFCSKLPALALVSETTDRVTIFETILMNMLSNCTSLPDQFIRKIKNGFTSEELTAIGVNSSSLTDTYNLSLFSAFLKKQAQYDECKRILLSHIAQEKKVLKEGERVINPATGAPFDVGTPIADLVTILLEYAFQVSVMGAAPPSPEWVNGFRIQAWPPLNPAVADIATRTPMLGGGGALTVKRRKKIQKQVRRKTIRRKRV